MIVEKDDFPVEVTNTEGKVNQIPSDKLWAVIMKKNPEATQIEKIMTIVKSLRGGATVGLDALKMKGVTARRI